MSVANKDRITCSEDEMRTLAPEGLQAALDAAVSRVPQGRCFVRPSGTENCVRIYAEAATQALADQLVEDAVIAIRTFVK